jgi:polyisoprenoid-binding protein YceI
MRYSFVLSGLQRSADVVLRPITRGSAANILQNDGALYTRTVRMQRQIPAERDLCETRTEYVRVCRIVVCTKTVDLTVSVYVTYRRYSMKSLAFAAALALTAPMAFAETWVPDPGHTRVTTTWNHAGFSMQAAQFQKVEGSLEFEAGDIAGAKADFSVMVDSVVTGIDALDTELKGPGFLDAANHPAIRFVSTSVEQTGDMTVKATGDFTMKGVTMPVTFDITVHSMGEHPVGQFFDYYKGEWLGLTATTTIKRSEFGVEAFIPVGSDEIQIEISSEMRAGGWN